MVIEYLIEAELRNSQWACSRRPVSTFHHAKQLVTEVAPDFAKRMPLVELTGRFRIRETLTHSIIFEYRIPA